ncbi:hypothetical protein M422DRAFT_52712 [Sphaerobolus stellatus SS14]|uniref:C2H2-type domain-containing protein n=1 Tax=Sphaerobolus stellatus (strain SS14) TaxID=990650 RepID=A0A0C9TRC8_SPHS4|nr:hypothetical protein M422DRAFT_52712 [Sphaerobolus stellatus SS14]
MTSKRSWTVNRDSVSGSLSSPTCTARCSIETKNWETFKGHLKDKHGCPVHLDAVTTPGPVVHSPTPSAQTPAPAAVHNDANSIHHSSSSANSGIEATAVLTEAVDAGSLSTPHLLYLPELTTRSLAILMPVKCVICVECQHGIQSPDGAIAHLKSVHGVILKLSSKVLTQIWTDHACIRDPKHLPPVSQKSNAFPGLKVEEGVCCNSCNYCVTTMSGSLIVIRRHWASAHHDAHFTANSYHKGSVQNFFPSNKRYFEVTPSSSVSSQNSPYELYLNQIASQFSPIPNYPHSINEIPLLLQKTGWHIYLKDVTPFPDKVQEIMILLTLPQRRGEGWEAQVKHCIMKYMTYIHNNATNSPSGVKALLKNCPSIQGKEWSTFPRKDTLNRYSVILVRLTLMVLRSLDVPDKIKLLHLSPEDIKHAQDLLNILKKKETDSIDIFHNFIKPILATHAEASQSIADDIGSPYNAVDAYQKHASHIVKNSDAPPTTRVDIDGLRITFKEHTVDLPKWRDGILKLYQNASTAINDLLLQKDYALHVPDNIQDDWCNEAEGYSWMDHVSVPDNRLLQQYFTDKDIYSIDNNNNISCKIPEIHKILKQIAAITRLVILLFYFSPSGPIRISELADHKIRNGLRPRTIFRDGQDIWTADMRLKTEGLTDTNSFIPAKCPPQFSRILETYLLLIRPFETTLVQIIHGKTDPGAVYLTSHFLCVQEGHKVSETTISGWIKDFFREHCHVPVGPREYRQVAVEIIRVFLGSEQLVREAKFDTLASTFGHSLAMSRSNYAREHGRGSMTSDRLLHYGRMSELWWHIWGGIPDTPPMEPLASRLQQNDPPVKVSELKALLNEHSHQLMTAFQESVSKILKRPADSDDVLEVAQSKRQRTL